MTMQIIFFSLCVLATWIIGGYFIFLKIVTCCKKLPAVCRADNSFSIVLVTHNAKKHILKKVDELKSYSSPRLEKIWVVDDGSDDDSLDFIDDFGDKRFVVLRCDRSGKSAALNQVRTKIESDCAVLMDVRQSLTEQDVLKMVDRVNEDEVGAVSGVLCLNEGDKSYWDLEKKIRYHEGLLGKTIGLSGSGAAIKTACWKEIPNKTLADDLALGLSVLSQGKKVCFDPEVKIKEPLASSLEIEIPRKIRTLSANWQIVFSPFTYDLPKSLVTLFFLFSHKFLRLLMPFVFIGIVLSGYCLKCDILNVLFYVLLLLSAMSFLPIKFLNPVKQLIYLNVAALAAFVLWPSYSNKGSWSST